MRLNIGSGDQKKEGYKSVDMSDKCNPDYVWDITQFPYPKEWEGCKEVRSDNLFEHIEPKTLIRVINEIHKILMPGGKLWIRVPLLNANPLNIHRAFTDPTHCNYFTIETFDYWEDKPNQAGLNRWKMFGKDYGIIPWKRIMNEEWNKTFLIVELVKI